MCPGAGPVRHTWHLECLMTVFDPLAEQSPAQRNRWLLHLAPGLLSYSPQSGGRRATGGFQLLGPIVLLRQRRCPLARRGQYASGPCPAHSLYLTFSPPPPLPLPLSPPLSLSLSLSLPPPIPPPLLSLSLKLSIYLSLYFFLFSLAPPPPPPVPRLPLSLSLFAFHPQPLCPSPSANIAFIVLVHFPPTKNWRLFSPFLFPSL